MTDTGAELLARQRAREAARRADDRRRARLVLDAYARDRPDPIAWLRDLIDLLGLRED